MARVPTKTQSTRRICPSVLLFSFSSFILLAHTRFPHGKGSHKDTKHTKNLPISSPFLFFLLYPLSPYSLCSWQGFPQRHKAHEEFAHQSSFSLFPLLSS